jgi:hypothetical protein
MNKFYVYGHYIDGDQSPFYIGKGCRNRAYTFTGRSDKWKSICKDKEVIVKYFKTDLSSVEALTLEAELITEYKPSGNLINTSVVKTLDFDYINSILYYDETSPTFLRWKKDFGWTGKYFIVKQGDIAGCITKTNKAYITLKRKTYFAHRIVWMLHNKNLVDGRVIDHIDGDRSNNCILNLRQVSVKTNTRNKKKSSRNKSDITGVYLKNMKGDPYWTATWQDMQGNKHVKYFSVNKYSDEGAKELAIATRKESIDLLNKQGAGYTARHSGEDK